MGGEHGNGHCSGNMGQPAKMAANADDHRRRHLVFPRAQSSAAVRTCRPDGHAGAAAPRIKIAGRNRPLSEEDAFFRQFTSTDRGKPWQIRI
jgi:hypothetical protein